MHAAKTEQPLVQLPIIKHTDKLAFDCIRDKNLNIN